MGSALLNPESIELTRNPADGDALRLEVAERLAAHRSRRAQARRSNTVEPERKANTRSARIAAAVAERYAHTPSYRAFLAAEAARAIEQARAAAEVATLNARAVAAAQQQMLDAFDQATDNRAECDGPEVRGTPLRPVQTARERYAESDGPPQAELHRPVFRELNLWPELEPAGEVARSMRPRPRTAKPAKPHAEALQPSARPGTPAAGLIVRLYEDTASATHVPLPAAQHMPSAGRSQRYDERDDPEARALDEEIAFRQAPVFDEPAGPPMPLPANLIEFPRHLVAARKVRPRYAEGPLREEAEAAPGDGQLRIFEVDAAQISTAPNDETGASPVQWTSIWLDTRPEPSRPQANAIAQDGPEAHPSFVEPAARAVGLPGVASLGRRMLAAAINGVIVLAGVGVGAAAFVMLATRTIPGQSGVTLGQALTRTGLPLNLFPAAVAGSGALLYLVYHALFFWYSAATPGMRCARIGLCTFDDENPSRRARSWRILAVLMSAFPLGLGFAWAALDEERLAWHDRICRIYQRSY